MPHTGPQIIHIFDPADPRLADYANLKDRQLAALGPPSGLFMAEGELVVRQLILSPLSIRSILITPTRLETMRDVIDTLPADTPVYLIPLDLMSTIVGFHIHRGVLAVGVRPPPPGLASILATARTLVILEDLANHDNIGGLFRTTAALAGFDAAILLSPRCCDPLYRKAIRVSIGAALRLPFTTLDPWPDSLNQIRRAGFQVLALTPDPAAPDIASFNPPPKAALLLGAEGPGLTPATQAHCQARIRIPMAPGMDSLNVVVAAGIALARLASSPDSSPTRIPEI